MTRHNPHRGRRAERRAAERRQLTAQRVGHPDGGHDYLSTACLHGKRESCRVTCKFCPAACRCGCHQGGECGG